MNWRRLPRVTPFRLIGLGLALVVLYLGWAVMQRAVLYAAMEAAPQGQASGPAHSDVTIVEFMDYRCEACRALAPVLATVLQRHPDVRIVYRHRPTKGQAAVDEALYALAAGKQGHFSAMHELLIARTDPVQAQELPTLCQQAQVDCDRLLIDMHGKDLGEELLRTIEATHVLHFNGVPTFLINRRLYRTEKALPTADDFDRVIANIRKAEK